MNENYAHIDLHTLTHSLACINFPFIQMVWLYVYALYILYTNNPTIVVVSASTTAATMMMMMMVIISNVRITSPLSITSLIMFIMLLL